jgi:response regulator RpfG family c-di-GMP phosphodiesterase
MDATAELRILMLEDEPTDAALAERELRRSGLNFTAAKADRRPAFLRALDEFDPDVVLVDYKLPDFDGLSAVKLVRQKSPDLPVILVTGALRDEQALEVIKAGANDYVLKDRLVQLPFVVRRALLEAAESRARRRAERALLTLGKGNQALVRATGEQQLLTSICQALVETGGYDAAWVGLAEHDAAKSVRLAAVAGRDAAEIAAAPMSWADDERGRGPTGTAIRTGVLQLSREPAGSPSAVPWRQAASPSSLALPLADTEGCFGALAVRAAEPDAFDAAEVALLTELAADLAYGVGALRTRERAEASAARLQKSLEATIEAIAGTIEMRDRFTAGHQRRVSSLAVAIARRLGLAEDAVKGIALAGKIIDIGKINVPSEILNKPGKATPLDTEFIRAHVQGGYDIIKGVEFPWPIAKTVLQHHERLDGSGYPNGLKADEICLEARIIGVADVVEGMMSHRPYRAALGLEAALAEIAAGRGSRYDAGVVEACIALFRQDGFTLPPAIQ